MVCLVSSIRILFRVLQNFSIEKAFRGKSKMRNIAVYKHRSKFPNTLPVHNTQIRMNDDDRGKSMAGIKHEEPPRREAGT